MISANALKGCGERAVIRMVGRILSVDVDVTFHGTAAAFTVISSSHIATTVPTGATTGEVTVTTASGTLISNVSFRVTP